MMTLKDTFSHSIWLCWFIVTIFFNKPRIKEVVKFSENIMNPEVTKGVVNAPVKG